MVKTNLDNCEFQNPTTFFSWLVVASMFLKTMVIVFSVDNPPAYLVNVSNKEVGIVWLYVRIHSSICSELM